MSSMGEEFKYLCDPPERKSYKCVNRFSYIKLIQYGKGYGTTVITDHVHQLKYCWHKPVPQFALVFWPVTEITYAKTYVLQHDFDYPDT